MHYKIEDVHIFPEALKRKRKFKVVNFIDIKVFRSLTSFLINSRYLQNNAITQLPETVFSGLTWLGQL